MSAEFPKKLAFLFEPHPYKCAYGGRYGLKSWNFARALLVLGANKPLRILCTREVQKSIRDSVHSLLSDQIQNLGLGGWYEVLENEIRGKTGTSFVFAGLAQHTIESIKSFEGADIVWVEEARTVSEKSWQILLPTIRKPGSEVWVTFNPELDDDPAYKRFVTNQPPGCVTVKTSYRDAIEAGWMVEKIQELMAHDKATLPKAEHENIWEGTCLPAVKGAIYADEIAAALEAQRVCNVPYDSKMKVHAIFDLGWNDQTSIILAQRHLSEIRVVGYIEDSHKTLDWYSAELRNLHYNWGSLFLPHDASHGTLQSGGKSSADILRGLKWDIRMVPNLPIETGIKQARMAFNKVYFDRVKAERLVQCLKRYKRNIPASTGEPASPVHDEFSHGADAFRYLALVANQMVNEDWKPIVYPKSGVI
jgi:phage terminase large subunit